MEFTFDNQSPLYLQLVEQLKINIMGGKIQPGQRLPSVRELALQTKVNPNTVQKALTALEDLGLVYTQRTNGKFVTENLALITKFKEEYAQQLTFRYLLSMGELGFTPKTTAAYLISKGAKES